MGGLAAVMALDKDEIVSRGIKPGGHSLEDLRDMPDHITIETLVESEYGEKDWDIEDTWGMINDGNHRTIAKILANDLEEIECYVGYREKSI